MGESNLPLQKLIKLIGVKLANKWMATQRIFMHMANTNNRNIFTFFLSKTGPTC